MPDQTDSQADEIILDPEAELDALDYIEAAIPALRLVSFSSLRSGPAVQAVIGWFRSLLDQTEMVAISARLGKLGSTSPNRRQIAELVIRLAWVGEHGNAAVDSLVELEKEQSAKHQKHMMSMGVSNEWIPDFSDLNEVVTKASAALASSSRGVTNAARELSMSGLYRAWWFETQRSHATAFLAVSLAPHDGHRYNVGSISTARQPCESAWNMLYFGILFVEVALQRLEAGDPGVLDAYSAAARTVEPRVAREPDE